MTTYTISLDDLDLALLPVPRPSNDFLKKELFEFRVMKNEDDDDNDSSVNELYKCHICAIEVPSSFSNAHNNGAKHLNNVKIATEAASRMRALLATNPPTVTQSRERFCDPCATIASEDHEKTKEHKVAVSHDRFLNNLSNLYVGEDVENDGENKRNAVTEAKGISKQTKKVNANSKFTVYENIENDYGDDTVKNMKPKAAVMVANKFTQTVKDITTTDAKANGEGDAKKATEYVKIPRKIYIKILKKTTAANFDVKIFHVDKIVIKTDNVKMIVSDDQFHSFYRHGTELVCLVCNLFLKSGEEEIHKLAVTHMEAITRIVDDRHCIRQINQNWSHCILCNVLVKRLQAKDHKATQSHLNKQTDYAHIIKPPVKPKVTQNVKPKPIEIPKIDKVVLAPNQTIPATNAATTNMNNIVKNEINESAKAELEAVKIISEISSVFPVDERIEYPYEPKDEGSVRCVICGCDVPRTVHNRADHLNGQRHANNVKKQFPPLSGF